MNHTAAHRDGSPYPLRMGHKVAPKEVGRTVSVSRRGKQFFVFFVGKNLKLQAEYSQRHVCPLVYGSRFGTR